MKRLLIAGALVLSLAGCSSAPNEKPFRGEGVPSVINENLKDEPDWGELEERMNLDPASVMAPDSLELVGGPDEFRKAIVEGTEFKVRRDSWTGTSASGGVIIEERTPSGIVIENFTILMEDIDRNWWITATMSVESAVKGGLYVEPQKKVDSPADKS